MTDEYVQSVSARYIELFEKVTGRKFEPQDYSDVINRVEQNVLNELESVIHKFS